MNIKSKIDKINELVSDSNNRKVLTKMAEAKGLYRAYELSKNKAILNEVITDLLDVIDTYTFDVTNRSDKLIKKAQLVSKVIATYDNFVSHHLLS